MKVFKSAFSVLLAILLTLTFICMMGCSNSDNDIFAQETAFNIGITDVPCTDLFTAVNVTFASFIIENVDTAEVIELTPDAPINILDYINPNVFVIPFDLEPGTYKVISVTIEDVEVESGDGQLTQEQVDAINAMLQTFMPVTFDFSNNPSATFTVPKNMETTVIIDINCNDSMLINGEGYRFDPQLDIIDVVHR